MCNNKGIIIIILTFVQLSNVQTTVLCFTRSIWVVTHSNYLIVYWHRSRRPSLRFIKTADTRTTLRPWLLYIYGIEWHIGIHFEAALEKKMLKSIQHLFNIQNIISYNKHYILQGNLRKSCSSRMLLFVTFVWFVFIEIKKTVVQSSAS